MQTVTVASDAKPSALEPILVSVGTAAELLGVCKRTVLNRIALGEIETRRIGRRVLIPYKHLLRYGK